MEPSDPTNPTNTNTTGIQGSPFPAASPSPIAPENVRNYQVAAIVVLILCSLPLGAIALYYSGKVKTALKEGNVEEARKASKQARLFVILGIVIGLPLSILYVASSFSS